MKTLFIFSFVLFASANMYSQSVAINSNGAAPDPQSILDLSGSSKGILLPRMTDAQMNALTTPKSGMLVFNTTQGVMMMQHGSDVTPSWQRSATNITTWNILGNAGTNSSTNFLGTTDAVPLIFKTNNTEHMQINTTGQIGMGTTAISNTRLTVNNTSNNSSTSTVVKGQTTQINMGAASNADSVILINTQFSYNNTGGTIEDFIGIKVGDISGTNSSFRNTGTISNTYGLYLGDISHGTQTNAAYSIYNSDANARIYSAGKVGIGVLNPTESFEVNGRIKGTEVQSSEGLVLPFAKVTATYTLKRTDYCVLPDGGGAHIITLPLANSVPAGKTYIILNNESVYGVDVTTVVTSGGDDIQGRATSGDGSGTYIGDGGRTWYRVNN